MNYNQPKGNMGQESAKNMNLNQQLPQKILNSNYNIAPNNQNANLPFLPIQQYEDIARRAIYLQQQKNYPLAKYTFVLAIEGIMNIQKAEKNPQISEALKMKIQNLFQNAEACNKLSMAEKQRVQNDPFVIQINTNILEVKANIFFKDISGLENVKQALQESVIFPNARPDIFQGIRAPPRGILLYGPPGNGKTLIARAVACESKISFYNISASSLVSKLMGDGERLVKSLFLCAYQNQPSIIFIDEVDSILKARSESEHEASRRLKTEFLMQFDGANTSDQDRVIVIGATNRPEEIDSAALRRFTKRIFIDMPDQRSRTALIKQYSTGSIFDMKEQDYDTVSKKLSNYSCSDIKALVKEACMVPLRKLNKDELLVVDPKKIPPVRVKDFEEAMKKIPPSTSKKEIEYFQKLQKQYNQQS